MKEINVGLMLEGYERKIFGVQAAIVVNCMR